MLSNWRIPQGGAIQVAVLPGDVNGVALTGPWAGLKQAVDLLIILILDTAATEPVLTLEQATDAAGTDAKALPISDLSTLIADDLKAVAPDELWDENKAINRTNPVTTYDTSETAISGKEGIFVMRVHQDDLDDGFTHVRINTPAIGTSRGATVLYVAPEKTFRGNPNSGV